MCNQTGKVLLATMAHLSKENGEPLGKDDIIDGKTVIYESSNGKTYYITISIIISVCVYTIQVKTL